jgi:hypothetical protein
LTARSGIGNQIGRFEHPLPARSRTQNAVAPSGRSGRGVPSVRDLARSDGPAGRRSAA